MDLTLTLSLTLSLPLSPTPTPTPYPLPLPATPHLGLVGEDVGLLGGRGGGGGGLGARDRAGAQREAWVLQAVRLEDLVCGVLGVGVRL